MSNFDYHPLLNILDVTAFGVYCHKCELPVGGTFNGKLQKDTIRIHCRRKHSKLLANNSEDSWTTLTKQLEEGCRKLQEFKDNFIIHDEGIHVDQWFCTTCKVFVTSKPLHRPKSFKKKGCHIQCMPMIRTICGRFILPLYYNINRITYVGNLIQNFEDERSLFALFSLSHHFTNDNKLSTFLSYFESKSSDILERMTFIPESNEERKEARNLQDKAETEYLFTEFMNLFYKDTLYEDILKIIKNTYYWNNNFSITWDLIWTKVDAEPERLYHFDFLVTDTQKKWNLQPCTVVIPFDAYNIDYIANGQENTIIVPKGSFFLFTNKFYHKGGRNTLNKNVFCLVGYIMEIGQLPPSKVQEPNYIKYGP